MIKKYCLFIGYLFLISMNGFYFSSDLSSLTAIEQALSKKIGKTLNLYIFLQININRYFLNLL